MASTATKRVLVVEDEDAIRETLRYNLAREGYTVIEAATGPDALTQARAEHPDVILLDVMLPGLSGLEVCRVLRQELSTPDPHADGQGVRGRQGGGPPARRRRLCDQAVLVQRAARADHRAAPSIGDERPPIGGSGGGGVRRLPHRSRGPDRPPRGRRAAPRPEGVRPALAPAPQLRPGAVAAGDHRRGVGQPVLRRPQDRGRPRPLAPGEVRAASRRCRSGSRRSSAWAIASIGSARTKRPRKLEAVRR